MMVMYPGARGCQTFKGLNGYVKYQGWKEKMQGVVVRMSSKNRNVYGIISRDQGVIRAGSWDCWIQVMRISMRPRLAWKDPSSKQPIVK